MKALFLTGLLLVAFATPIFAEATLGTPTLSLDSTQLTTGTTRTVTVSLSSTGGTATASTVGLRGTGQSGGSSITVNDPASGSYSSVSVTTSATKDFTVTAGTADTYSLVGWCIGTSDTTEKASVESYLTFINPSVLTLSVTSDPAGRYKYGQSLTYSIELRNTLTSSVTTSYSLSGTTGLTKASGDPVEATLTLSAGQTYPLTWTYSPATTYTGATLSFKLGTTEKDTVALTAYPECNNSVDDDGDSYTDYSLDAGCSGYTDTDEHNSAYQCDDGIDNDADGYIDYKATGGDPNCDSVTDNAELAAGGSGGGTFTGTTTTVKEETAQQKTMSGVSTLVSDAKLLITSNPASATEKLASAATQSDSVAATMKTDVSKLDLIKTTELANLGLFASDITAGRQLLAEAESLLANAKAEADLTKKAALLEQASAKETAALEKLPEVEKVAEVSDTAALTAATAESALKSATDEAAKTAINAVQSAMSGIGGKVSVSRSLTTYKVTNKELTTAEEKRSKATLKVVAKAALKDVEIVEVIPKDVAQSASELVFTEAPEVLQKDPIVRWTIASLAAGESKDLSYIVQKELAAITSTTLASAKAAEAQPVAPEVEKEPAVAPEEGAAPEVPPAEAPEVQAPAGISKASIFTIVLVLIAFVVAAIYQSKKK